jgi:hypothetical protein
MTVGGHDSAMYSPCAAARTYGTSREQAPATFHCNQVVAQALRNPIAEPVPQPTARDRLGVRRTYKREVVYSNQAPPIIDLTVLAPAG